MPATLNDIAQSLNVSISLVSKALSGKLGTTVARDETIDAIRKRASELGYIKNPAATGLATGRQNVIGVYIHCHGVSGSGIGEALVEGIAREARQVNQRLMLTYYELDHEFEELATQIDSRVVDGIIVGGIGHVKLAGLMEKLQQKGLPVVTVMDAPISSRIMNIGVDQHRIGQLATEHLADQGCVRIANLNAMSRRFEGYRAGLASRRLRFQRELVYTAPYFTYEWGQRAVEHFLSEGIEFDGIVAQSDQLAVGALHALLKAGRRVPDDVRLIGVDNSPFCQFSIVPLSSISQEDRARGVKAMEYLMEAQKPARPQSIFVDPVLYPRESSGNTPRLS